MEPLSSVYDHMNAAQSKMSEIAWVVLNAYTSTAPFKNEVMVGPHS